ncbi:SNF1 protein kinase subunit beta-2 [Grifola frondosa]|uniref:SNF1 protein kinase subunit beta-2 n=1 Tax=Grifola frondosa TaxID=5627 RepID=A0A1C7M466_GRIFR|nr:SNF1 protein kinase subunit beta-2 [Grifola frondosa]
MGNTTSNPSAVNPRPASPSRSAHSPIRHGSPNPASSSSRVHRSLRTKKKSLELPDLASLTLTPSSPSPASSPHPNYRRPRASSPIPIPTSANPPQPTFRPQNNLPSAAHINLRMNDGRQRHKSYLSSAYPSTRSFISGDQNSPPNHEPVKPEFVREVVHSTIPLALVKPEEDVAKPEPVNVKIVWRTEERKLVGTRRDNNWQGRQPMDFDPQTNTFWTMVSLLPGTHHLKFLVDDQWRLADDYPRAVDDRDGSLANYVAVPASTSSSSPVTLSASASPLASPHHGHPNQYNSFWSDSSSGPTQTGKARDGEWTTDIPQELIAAAAEEEAYLASTDPSSSTSGVPTPNIPPAPVLPRHLDKLILNVRPSAMVPSSGSGGGDRDKKRSGKERERSRRDRDRDRDRDRESRARPSNLGMALTAAIDGAVPSDPAPPADDNFNVPGAPPPPLALPIVTASGTDVSSTTLASQVPSGPSTPPATSTSVARPLDAPGLADDASVLPVPSHVVLHHLSTSAIRNGVLAVANTTRYRKKVCKHRSQSATNLTCLYSEQYITTVYYKPT